MKIVFIDDEKGMDSLIGRFLVSKGYTDVSFIYTSQEGISFLEKQKPELAFLDINMETDKEGFKILEWGKKNCPNTKYVMCSAYREDFREVSLKSGADGFVGKPMRPDELLQIIALFEKK
jgi:DNA-binding response OmpR family regulator